MSWEAVCRPGSRLTCSKENSCPSGTSCRGAAPFSIKHLPISFSGVLAPGNDLASLVCQTS